MEQLIRRDFRHGLDLGEFQRLSFDAGSPMSILTHPAVKTVISTGQNGAIPPLENGDRLTRAEFMRRYDAMPDLKKAELIEGVVYVSSPVRQKYHGEPHSDLVGWLFVYKAGTPGVATGDNSTVLLDLDNAPQPDGLLFVKPEHGGRVKLNADGYIENAPDLVGEIAASSASYDLHDKLNAYRRNGVREYVVHRVLDAQVDWFVLREGRFESLAASPDGLLRSTVFPGLWLDPAALIRGDAAMVMEVVQRGLSSPEHAEFAARLQASGASR
jgi:Uma2 family endonuclease